MNRDEALQLDTISPTGITVERTGTSPAPDGYYSEDIDFSDHAVWHRARLEERATAMAREANHWQVLARRYRQALAAEPSLSEGSEGMVSMSTHREVVAERDAAHGTLGEIRGKGINLGCDVDSAVALICVCSDVAEVIGQRGSDFIDHLDSSYLYQIADKIRELGFGERTFYVTMTFTRDIVARSDDRALDVARNDFYAIRTHSGWSEYDYDVERED